MIQKIFFTSFFFCLLFLVSSPVKAYATGPTYFAVGPGSNCSQSTGTCSTSPTAPNIGRFVCDAPPHAINTPCNQNDVGFDPANSEVTNGNPSLTYYVDHAVKPGGSPVSCGQTVQIDVTDINDLLVDWLLWYSGDCPITNTPTPIPPTPTGITGPTIQTMNVNNLNTTSFSGPYGTSGRPAADQGSDWLNPLKVKLTVAKGSSQDITAYYVAFYDKTLNGGTPLTEANFLNTLKFQLSSDRKKGLLLAYGYPDDITGGGGSLAKKFYVWQGTSASPSWFDIQPGAGKNITNAPNLSTVVYFVDGITNDTFDTSNPSTVAWQISFSSPFGTKSMFTGAYVIDDNNRTHFLREMTTTP